VSGGVGADVDGGDDSADVGMVAGVDVDVGTCADGICSVGVVGGGGYAGVGVVCLVGCVDGVCVVNCCVGGIVVIWCGGNCGGVVVEVDGGGMLL